MERSYSPGDMPLPGYRLVQFLGRGAYGEVWKAVRRDKIEVALKLLSLEDKKRGIKEYRGLQRVRNYRHPNLVPINGFYFKDRAGKVLDFTDESDSVLLGLATELIIDMGLGEKTLLDRLRECQNEDKEGIPAEELLGYMDGSAKGIDFLNGFNRPSGTALKPIQHGDIKPQNIMIVGGEPQICDFGLARVLGTDVRATQANAGAIAYSSPEALDDKGTDKSDQYSLAITYVELRTGSLPFQARTQLAIMSEIVKGELDLSMLPPPEREVIKRATALNPADRFPSSAEMVRGLRATISGSPSTPSKQKLPAGPRRPGHEIVPGYKLVSQIGAGGYGQVWTAIRPGGFSVALKIVDHLEDNAGKQEFKALKLIKKLYHDNLLELRGYWLLDKNGEIIPDEQQDKPGSPLPSTLVIETRLADKNLLQRLKECGEQNGIPPDDLLNYMRQAAEAIDFMNEPQHEFEGQTISIQHRDVKPENILLVGKKVQVADFGLVRILEGERGRVHAGSRGFTPHYAAPELFVDEVTRWTDQYSLALTYYRLRTGKELFARNLGWGEIMLRHTKGKLDLEALPTPERDVISQATSPEPARRFASCLEMVAALEQALYPIQAEERLPRPKSTPVVTLPRPFADKKPDIVTPPSKPSVRTPVAPRKTDRPIATPHLEPVSDGPTTDWPVAEVLVESQEGQLKETQGPAVEKVDTPTLVSNERPEPEWKTGMKQGARAKPKSRELFPKVTGIRSSKRMLWIVLALLLFVGGGVLVFFSARAFTVSRIRTLIEENKFADAYELVQKAIISEKTRKDFNAEIQTKWRNQLKSQLDTEEFDTEELVLALNSSKQYLSSFVDDEVDQLRLRTGKGWKTQGVNTRLEKKAFREAVQFLNENSFVLPRADHDHLENMIRESCYTHAWDDLLAIIETDPRLEQIIRNRQALVAFNDGKDRLRKEQPKPAKELFDQVIGWNGIHDNLKIEAKFWRARANSQLGLWNKIEEDLPPNEGLNRKDQAIKNALVFLADLPKEIGIPSEANANDFLVNPAATFKSQPTVKLEFLLTKLVNVRDFKFSLEEKSELEEEWEWKKITALAENLVAVFLDKIDYVILNCFEGIEELDSAIRQTELIAKYDSKYATIPDEKRKQAIMVLEKLGLERNPLKNPKEADLLYRPLTKAYALLSDSEKKQHIPLRAKLVFACAFKTKPKDYTRIIQITNDLNKDLGLAKIEQFGLPLLWISAEALAQEENFDKKLMAVNRYWDAFELDNSRAVEAKLSAKEVFFDILMPAADLAQILRHQKTDAIFNRTVTKIYVEALRLAVGFSDIRFADLEPIARDLIRINGRDPQGYYFLGSILFKTSQTVSPLRRKLDALQDAVGNLENADALLKAKPDKEIPWKTKLAAILVEAYKLETEAGLQEVERLIREEAGHLLDQNPPIACVILDGAKKRVRQLKERNKNEEAAKLFPSIIRSELSLGTKVEALNQLRAEEIFTKAIPEDYQNIEDESVQIDICNIKLARFELYLKSKKLFEKSWEFLINEADSIVILTKDKNWKTEKAKALIFAGHARLTDDIPKEKRSKYLAEANKSYREVTKRFPSEKWSWQAHYGIAVTNWQLVGEATNVNTRVELVKEGFANIKEARKKCRKENEIKEMERLNMSGWEEAYKNKAEELGIKIDN